jgi:hypothetical protein
MEDDSVQSAGNDDVRRCEHVRGVRCEEVGILDDADQRSGMKPITIPF